MDDIILKEDIQKGGGGIRQMLQFFVRQRKDELYVFWQTISLDGLKNKGTDFVPTDIAGKSLLCLLGSIKIQIPLAFDDKGGEGSYLALPKMEGIKGISL